MKVRLEIIGEHNWEEAIDLPVSEDHKNFVASNLYSIAEAQFYPGVSAYAIYDSDKMIGFAMCGAALEQDDDDDDVYPGTLFWIWRFMIAEGERFKGYGKEAMKLIIEDAAKNDHKAIYLSTEPENEKAIRFYTSLGFKTTGLIQADEEVFVLSLPH